MGGDRDRANNAVAMLERRRTSCERFHCAIQFCNTEIANMGPTVRCMNAGLGTLYHFLPSGHKFFSLLDLSLFWADTSTLVWFRSGNACKRPVIARVVYNRF